MYSSIAIEGGIGAGKTTFATWLAEELGAELMLERFEENPFLEKFYDNPEAHGFSVELSFLADRYKQMQAAIRGRNLFKQRMVSDYACEEFDFRQSQPAQRRIQPVQNHVHHDARPAPPTGGGGHLTRAGEAGSPDCETGSVLRTIASRGLFGPGGGRLRLPLQACAWISDPLG